MSRKPKIKKEPIGSEIRIGNPALPLYEAVYKTAQKEGRTIAKQAEHLIAKQLEALGEYEPKP